MNDTDLEGRSLASSLRKTLPIALLALSFGCSSVQGARLYSSGTEALDRGDTSQAVDALEAAATLLPEASEIQNHLGVAYSQAGREEDAMAAFRRSVELDCTNDAAQYNLRAAEAGRFAPPDEPDER